MPDLNQDKLCFSTSSSNYEIRLANHKDITALLKYDFFNKLILYFLIAVYFIGFLFSIPAGYSSWKQIHKSFAFELGIEALTSPNLSDWLYILYKALIFALIFPLLMIMSFSCTYLFAYLYYKKLFYFNLHNNIYRYWIVKYHNEIVGKAIFRVSKNYSRLCLLSIQAKYQNRGLGSLLLNQAMKYVRKPIYLMCFPKLQKFYRRLGFVSLSWQQIPLELKSVPWVKVMRL